MMRHRICLSIVLFLPLLSPWTDAFPQERKEVFVFLLQCNSSVWTRMDWTKITTVALAGWVDPQLVQHAHQTETRVVYIPTNYSANMQNRIQRKIWIDQQIDYSSKHHLDGINFDYENAVARNSLESKGYLALVKETFVAFKKLWNSFQISIDFGWSPGADGRAYMYKQMSKYVDVVFVMGYDTQSQMFGRQCRARPNSPLMKVYRGIQKYIQMGIPKKKMVLGVPWYGYKYPCINLVNRTCTIQQVPFRGVNCSDAAGAEFAYKDIVDMERRSLSGTHWDHNSQTLYFELVENGISYQVWFDNPTSLSIKYQVSGGMDLGGIGFWTGNYLDYSNSSMVQQMWSAVPNFNNQQNTL